MSSGVAERESSLTQPRRHFLRRRFAPSLAERRFHLFFGDQLAVLIALALSGEAAALTYDIGTLIPVFGTAFVWWVAASAFDCYDLRRAAQPFVSTLSTWAAIGLTSIALLAIEIVRPGAVPIVPIGAFTALALVLLAGWRLIYVVVFTRSPLRRRALVVGGGADAAEAVRILQAEAAAEYDVVGIVSTNPGADDLTLGVLGSPAALGKLVLLHSADEVIVAAPDDDREAINAVRAALEANPHVAVRHFSTLYEHLRGRVHVRFVATTIHWRALVEARASALPFIAAKRIIDVVASLAALPFFAALFGGIALAIKLDSKGPIVYRQQREGLHGRPFTMLKFRTMVDGAETGDAVWASHRDPRRTRVGKFLRRWHLDETLQLLNVLAGSMSLVGPRPERTPFVRQLERAVPAYRDRMLVRPGITGWAQVRYGYARSLEESVEKLEYDLYYVKHWSPFLDFVIALKTFQALVRRTVEEPSAAAPASQDEASSVETEPAPSSVSVAST